MRRRQTAETRERIVKAGREILHGFPIWNWDAVTVHAVAERSGVSERTVYRYFASERELRDAVMARITEDAHVNLETLQFEGIRDIASRIIDYTASFPFERASPQDATLETARQRQRDALVAALVPVTQEWPSEAREVVAAMLNVLWSYASYKLLVGDWNLEPKEAAAGVRWLVELVEEAVRRNDRPAI